MALRKVGNIRQSGAGGSTGAPAGLKKVGNLRTGVKVAKTRPVGTNNPNYIAAQPRVAEAQRIAQESSSAKGIVKNAFKAAPQAIRDVLVGTPAKFVASALEAPGVAYNKQYTDRTYKVPGLTPFKSFQSDYGDVEKQVIEGKKGLGSAAWELAKIPLAGAETLGLAKGIGKIAGATKSFAKAPSVARLGNLGGEVTDTFLPTTRGLKKVGNINEAKPTGKVMSPVRQFVSSGGRVLRESGESGKKLEQTIRKQQLDADLMLGKDNRFLSETFKGLSKAEKENVTDLLEGKAKPVSDKASQAAQKMKQFYGEKAKAAQAREFTVRTPDGKDVAFTPREDYAPRYYDWDEIAKGEKREKTLNHLVSTGQARNKAEATKLLDEIIAQNSQRRAGNLENVRQFDLPDYEKDAEKAARMYADSSSRRFTEADNFGKKDEIVAELINKISEEGGDYNEAQKIFEYMYKGLPKSKVASALTQYNLVTKLDLGALTNLTQTVNTATKAGVLNTLKGIFKGFTKDGDDLAELANVYDEMVVVNETGLKMSKFVKGVMYAFGKVERFNRRVAANAGKFRAEELASRLAKNPESATAIRQLQSLGLDPSKLVNGKLTADDVVIAANRMSELTQFKPNVLNVPRYWKTPLGRVAMQFKSFAFMQTRFFVDEVVKEAANGNIMPLMRFLILAPTASYYTYQARNKITGRDPGDTSLNADVRTTDRWLKAFGTYPTSLYGDASYLRKELSKDMNNPKEFYATPLYKGAKVFGQFGPTAGSVGNLVSSLESDARTANTNNLWYGDHPEAKKDENLGLKRFVAGDIPFIGEYLKNTKFRFGQETTAQQAEKLAKQGLQEGDYEKVKQAIEIDPYLNNQTIIKRLMKEADMETWSQEDRDLYEEIQNRKKKPTRPFFTP